MFARTINQVIKASGNQQPDQLSDILSDELLALVVGGAPPTSSPHYPTYEVGMGHVRDGLTTAAEGTTVLWGGTLLPPPVGPVIMAGGAVMMAAGADEVAQGKDMMNSADAAHQASLGSNQNSSLGSSQNYQTYEPNMSMSDGTVGYNGESLVYTYNEAGTYY